MINYVVMVMDCLCLIYKSNSKMVQRLTAEMDKFRMFFKHPKVCKSLQQYIITLKKGSLDNNMGVSLNIFIINLYFTISGMCRWIAK